MLNTKNHCYNKDTKKTFAKLSARIKKIPNSTKIEEAYKGLLEELLEEDKKLEEINKRIEKSEILERVDTKEKIKLIKRIETEILDETKVFWKNWNKITKSRNNNNEKRLWEKSDEQETLERLKRNRDRETNKSN